jgi:hypothetical protein
LPARPKRICCDGFCERCRSAGIELSRAIALIDTLHPIYEGRAFRWRNDGVEEEAVLEYRSTSVGEAAENWRRSAFFYLLETGESEVRRRIGMGEPADCFNLDVMQAEGQSDFVALAQRFASDGVIGEMDCFYSHWVTRAAEGFRELDLAARRRLVPCLGLAIKCASLARIRRHVDRRLSWPRSTQRVICCSYAQDLAAKHARDCRSVMESPWYRKIFARTRIDPRKNTEAARMLRRTTWHIAKAG